MNQLSDPPRIVDSNEVPAGLRALFERASMDHPPPAEIEAMVRAVERNLGPHIPSDAPSPPATGPASVGGIPASAHPWFVKVVTTFVSVAVIGALGASGARYAHRRGSHVAPEVDTGVPPVGEPAPSTGSERSGELPGSGAPTVAEAPGPASNVAPPRGLDSAPRRASRKPDVGAAGGRSVPPVPESPEPEEYKKLATARGSLESDPARALALAEDHKRSFGNGMLAQEREAIAIEALARLGRQADARTRGGRFVTQYPTSPYRRRVESALAQPTDSRRPR